jgi:membrane dipeptidase
MSFPVFDLHCDTLSRLLGRNMDSFGSLLDNDCHISLKRAQKLPGYAQCFACFTTDLWEDKAPVSAVQSFERQIVQFQREMNNHPDKIAIAYSAADVEENYKNGLMSGILTIEGPAGFGFDPELLSDLALAGFRMTSLGWNEKNVLTGSNVTGGGLTDLGKAYVKEAQTQGMIVDVSHISDEGFWDIMEITEKPVIASHSNSRAVHNHSRNLTDDMFRALCQTGGLAGMNLYAAFLGENADIDTVCDHFFHFLELDPEGTHIALGGDLDGCDYLPSGFTGVDGYPAIALRLQERGLDENLIRNIFWNNALGVMRKCCT